MVSANLDWDDDEVLDPRQHDDHMEVIRRRDRGKMPVAKEARARAAGKATWRSRALSRRLGRSTDGMRNRRIKKVV